MNSLNRIAIISAYFQGDTCGLLGPQIAATIIQEQTSFDCIVIAVTRLVTKEQIKAALARYFGPQRPIIAFSTLHGRPDLFALAKELTQEGALTVLAGPQAALDYWGERDADQYPNRFPGLTDHFVCALHGPAEQAISFLDNLENSKWYNTPGLQYKSLAGEVIANPVQEWNERFLKYVNWGNIYQIDQTSLVPLYISEAQVVHQIGCPYAAKKRQVGLDYPASLPNLQEKKIDLTLKGCSFCDVAIDKGFYGTVDKSSVWEQIRSLPDLPDGQKIPFEFINENPLPYLTSIIKGVGDRGMSLSQINLTMRADWFVQGEHFIRQALTIARETKTRILLASVGFESFDHQLLQNFNKGVDVQTNLRAVQLMRNLKAQFPETFKYARNEGGIHGFIHPTPWDSQRSEYCNQSIINSYGLYFDILPEHSVPLIVHHASGLGQWIREIEITENIRFNRIGPIVAWWDKEAMSNER